MFWLHVHTQLCSFVASDKIVLLHSPVWIICTGRGNISHPFKQLKSCLETLWSSKTYPVLQLRGELGLELAHGATGVISLNEDFGSDGSLLPHVLQAVSLWKDKVTIETWPHYNTPNTQQPGLV